MTEQQKIIPEDGHNGALYPATADNTFFSNAHGTWTTVRRTYKLRSRAKLKKLKEIEIIYMSQ